MTVSTIKPTGGLIPEVLKLLKDGFDDARLDLYEPNLYRAAMLSTLPEVVMWKGEILHQLALRAERRGELQKAFRLYKLAIPHLKETSVQGEARCLRDMGIRLALTADPDDGVETVRLACELHHLDVEMAEGSEQESKGERQLLVGHGYLLRARVIGDEDRRSAIQELIDLTIVESPGFSLRDQTILVNFTSRHAQGAARRELHRRQLELNARRLKPIDTVKSIAQVVIDTQLHMTGQMVGSVLRKEWTLPRPW